MKNLLAGAAVALLLATGCTAPSGEGPGKAKVDVDTAELRAMKADSEIAECEPGTDEHVDGGLPEVTLPCLGGGESVDLSTLRGPMVVNLWAAWCGPCRREMPMLEEFHAKWNGKVAVLGIDYNDTQTSNAMQLAIDSGVTYPLLADPQTELALKDPLPNIRGLPFTVLVDANGKVVHQEYAEIKSLGQLEDMVEKHLGVTE
ncbi:thiol-disulfide isomerase/thioredoxin [Nocardioides daedukensis]|uniref:Thiol-disulfide isomerase/thioredoxin n=1 Tax=Nocardioides daedukensis TaxID=634462 RepID=A0A7Y9S0N6_9ACTN|nr:TlpA disulfide reductase family protein [Nocardioides daedukensis]NYG58996.1 thiol-disulfide isomerase/thioredoxin [Nocardioides daedukensis]